MKLLVFSHKVCWASGHSPTGYATDGGFVFHMQSLASSYEETVLLVPITKAEKSKGEVWFTDTTLKIVPLLSPFGSGLFRKLLFPIWFLWHLPTFIFYTLKTDVIHAPIPGDIGTIGMILAPLFRKKLFIRYCGNWTILKTMPEKFWGWYGETFAGKSIAYLCTGGDKNPPSFKNSTLQWIFSSSMLNSEIEGYQKKKINFSEEFNLVIGGRLIHEKGFGVLIEAFAALRTEIPNIRLIIYGDGPEKNKFEEQVKSLGLKGTVTFSGKLNSKEVHQILNNTDIFCFPTWSSEGFHKVVIEAMAHGLPVISTDVSVIPFLINKTDTPAGTVVEKQNVNALENAIMNYYMHPEIHKTHATNAKNIAAEYSLENWVDEINRILNKQWGTQLCRLRSIKK